MIAALVIDWLTAAIQCYNIGNPIVVVIRVEVDHLNSSSRPLLLAAFSVEIYDDDGGKALSTVNFNVQYIVATSWIGGFCNTTTHRWENWSLLIVSEYWSDYHTKTY